MTAGTLAAEEAAHESTVQPMQAAADCSACGSDRLFSAAFKRQWELHRCETCGSVRVWPQPAATQLARLYSAATGYFATAASDLAATPSTGARHIHDRFISTGAPGRRMMDVGCGNGQLIYHLRRLGWEVCGIDLNAHAVGIACANGLDVQHADLHSCTYPEASFDAVYMGDLIEHVPDPLATLQRACRFLRPDGLLMIRTPNAACGFARATLSVLGRLGLPWPHSEAPYHLHEFTPPGLATLMQRAGFSLLGFRCHGKTPFWYTLGGLGWFDCLKARMKRTGRYRCDWRLVGAAPKLVVSAALLLPFYGYGLIADQLRDSGRTLTLLARRPGETA